MASDPLTTHALARLLLAGPDAPVAVRDPDMDTGAAVLSVWRDVPLDAARSYRRHDGFVEHERVTLIDWTTGGCPVCGRGEREHKEGCPCTP